MSSADNPETIGVLCSYTPRELIEAMGFRTRLLGGFESETAEGGPAENLCSYVRRCASFLTGGDHSLAGVVLTDSCYPMLRLWDHLREDGRLPFTRLLRVPRNSSPEAVEFYRRELDELAGALAEMKGFIPDRERLREAIVVSNRFRSLQCRVKIRMLTDEVPGLAFRFATILTEGAEKGKGRVNDRLEELLRDDGEEGGNDRGRRPRLLVAGSFFINPELIGMLEQMGALVGAVDSCVFGRFGLGPIEPNEGDAIGNLAAAYLDQPPCPRMANSGDHVATMGELAADGRFDGVIFLLPRNCTPQAYHAPLWKETMGRAGVPTLILEVEDCDWSQPRSLTRLEAFLETLKEKTRGRSR